MKKIATAFLALSLHPNLGRADEPSNDQIKTVLDDTPFLSARAGGMAGALSPLADGLHAPFYNPAGIGGIHWERQKPLFVRDFAFPYVGVSINDNANSLQQDFTAKDASQSAVLGKSVLAASQGKRQYARAFLESGIVFSRFTLVHYEDMQFAAFDKSNNVDLGPTDKSIAASYRSTSGTGAGFSVCDAKEKIYLGAFTSYVTRSEFSGTFAYFDLVDSGERSKLLSKNNLDYKGLSTNLGMLWILEKKSRSALAVVSKDAGGTHYSLTNSSAHPEASRSKIQKENLSVAYSISPRVGKTGAFNFVLEGHHLNDKDIALNKKFRTGLELNLGGFGSDASFGLRAGSNLAGVSYGVNFNFGLINLEASSYAEDIGVGNRHVAERREQVVFMINVLDN